VYDPGGQLLYDSGSPQNVNVNLGVVKQLNAIETAGDSPKLRIISVGSSQTVPAKPPEFNNVKPGVPLQRDDKLFFVYRSVRVGESPFGFDLSPQAASDNARSNRAVAELIRDPRDGMALGSVKLSEGPAYGSAILQSVARGWTLASAIAVLLAAGIGWYISRRISAPVLALTGVTTRMRGGDLSSRADIRSRDEFGQLARSFNEMADQVETTVTALRRFVADASHELRTPLTALRTDLDLMLDEKDADSRAGFIADARAMVQRLEELNTNLLDLSRLEANHHPARESLVDLAELLRGRSEIYASQAEQSGLTYEQELPAEPVWIRADANEILRAVDNLLDNACKFTPQDGTVRVALSGKDGQALLSVADTGIGIPEEELPQLFNRFHRGRNAAAYRGSGLGLAIVRAIAAANGGTVAAQSAGVGKGSRFFLQFPVVP
jgi:two-component system sensor histidine kinase BaeS